MIQAMILAAMVMTNSAFMSIEAPGGIRGFDGMQLENGPIVANWEPETYEFSNYDLFLSATNAMTVQTVTNVVEEWFCDKCYPQNGNVILYDRHTFGKQDGMLMTKTTELCLKNIRKVTTTINRVYTITLKWKGKTRTLTHEEIVSETVKKYVKKEEWEKVK